MKRWLPALFILFLTSSASAGPNGTVRPCTAAARLNALPVCTSGSPAGAIAAQPGMARAFALLCCAAIAGSQGARLKIRLVIS